MMGGTLTFTRPRRVDDEAVEKCMVRTFDTEVKRRQTIEDDYRQKRMDEIDVGKFDVSQISMHDLWQKRYFDTQGGAFCPMNADWVCPRCHTQYGSGYPPEHCQVCGYESPMGVLVREGVWKR